MTRAARRVYGSGSASRGRRGAGAPGVLRLLRGYAFAIAGIAIGVAGVVALGAMSERIVRFIEGGDRFVLGQISVAGRDRKSTRLNSSHGYISYAVFCLKKKSNVRTV